MLKFICKIISEREYGIKNMPIIKSAIKRVKIAERQRIKNFAYKSKVKTTIKKFESSLNSDNLENANNNYKQCVSILDKASQKGIIPKNTVSRKKSLLSRKIKDFAQKAEANNLQDINENKE